MDLLAGKSFDERAKQLFAHQYAGIASYRKFCENHRVTPDSLNTWLDIPAVPTDVFKHQRLLTASEAVRTFRTSGTTQGLRGEHHFASLEHYEAAIDAPFKRYCLPDHARIPMVILAPSPGEVEDSSLSFMLGQLASHFGHPLYSGFFLSSDDHGELAFDWEGIVEMLESVAGPVMLLGTSFAFVDFFDTVDLDFELAAGSRVMETGGLKGKSREVSREELYGLFAERLGLASTHCIGEYSMTELSSQAYTDALDRGVSWDEALFRVPDWVRVVAVDPATLQPLPAGERGLLRWVDLANVDSVCAVQTSDLGVVHDDGGFELFGRASGTELRGCSLAIEELNNG